MAKKRKRSRDAQGTTKSSLWSAKEKATLYGWLDYCVEAKYSKADTLRIIAVKLEDVGSVRNDTNKITAKLHRDWNRFGAVGSKFDDIFEYGHGSSDIQAFTEQELIDIFDAKKKFVEEAEHGPLIRRSRRSQAGSQSRTFSRTPVQTPRNENQVLLQSQKTTLGSPYPAVKRCRNDGGSENVQGSRENGTGLQQKKHPKNAKFEFPNSRSDHNRNQTKKEKSLDIPLVTTESATIVADSEEESSTLEDLSSEDDNNTIRIASSSVASRKLLPVFRAHREAEAHRLLCVNDCLFKHHISGIKPGEILCNKCGTWQHYACVEIGITRLGIPNLDVQRHLCHKCSISSPREHIQESTSSSERIDGLDYKLSTAVMEIHNLKERLLEKELALEDFQLEAERLDHLSRHRNSVENQVKQIYNDNEGYQKFEQLLQEREEHIKMLEKKLGDRRSNARFAKLIPQSRESFGVSIGSYNGFAKLYEIVKQFSLQVELPSQIYSPALDEHIDLKNLLSTSLTNNTGEDIDLKELMQLNPRALLRSLTCSALLSWVFITSFPTFESTPLMKYRECLLKQDGANTVRNLDLAFYHSVIRGEPFKRQYINPEAEKLAIKFSQVLAPLFSATPNGPKESNWDGFATWGEVAEKWADRHSILLELFHQALELKDESCMNTEDYEMVCYPPDTRYDENTMTVEMEDGMTDLYGQHGGSVVKICVEAAIFSYAQGEVSDETAINPMMLSSNFVQRDVEQRKDAQNLVKAAVVLKDES